jgi:thiol:disulfide interchange protein
MFGLLWVFLTNPMTLLVVFGLVAAAGVLFAVAGPAKALKFLLDVRVLLIAALAAGVLGYAHLAKQNQKLGEQIATQKVETRTTTDAAATIRKRATSRAVRTVEKDRLSGAIEHAQPGQAQDDVMDEIASLQGNTAASAAPPAPRTNPDGVQHDKPDGAVRP